MSNEYESLSDRCLTIADGCSSAWDDAPEQFCPILKEASDCLSDVGHELRNSLAWQELTKLRATLAEAEADNNRLREIGLHGCDCSHDDACLFARQRDEARAELDRLRKIEQEYKRLRKGVIRQCQIDDGDAAYNSVPEMMVAQLRRQVNEQKDELDRLRAEYDRLWKSVSLSWSSVSRRGKKA